MKNDLSDIAHNDTLGIHQGVKRQNISSSSANPATTQIKNNSPNVNALKTNEGEDETLLPSQSPKVPRLKPTSIRKQRTLQDEHFHERKPLMSRTNYLDDSNVTLSSFRSSSFNNLSMSTDYSIYNKPFSTLLKEKEKRRQKHKQNKDCNISSQDIDVRAITNFYMSNTSQKQKDIRRVKDKKFPNEIDTAFIKPPTVDVGEYFGTLTI